jgi:hypothetical protein
VAANFRQRDTIGRCLIVNPTFAPLCFGPNQQLVVLALMRSFRQIMNAIGSCHVVQMLCAEENKVVQTFVPQRAQKPLHECLAIGGTTRSANCFGPHLCQGSIKTPRKFAIPIVLDESHPQARVARFLHERLGLRRHPRFVGMQRSSRKDDSPCLDMKEKRMTRLVST